MKYLPIFLLLFSCKPSVKREPINENTPIIKAIDSLASRSTTGMDRLNFAFSLMRKRDDFLIKKYENEVLYYQTGNEKYRRRCNRFVDSFHKYVHIMDSISKSMK